MSGQRVTIRPREAAALDRLLDAYLSTEESEPGRADLVAFYQRLRRVEQDHAAYDKT